MSSIKRMHSKPTTDVSDFLRSGREVTKLKPERARNSGLWQAIPQAGLKTLEQNTQSIPRCLSRGSKDGER